MHSKRIPEYQIINSQKREEFKMKNNVFYLLIITLLLTIPVMVVCQERDIKLTNSNGKQTLKTQMDNNVLYEQIIEPSDEGMVACQDFSDYPEFSCLAADDFTVPYGSIWILNEVLVKGYYDSQGNLTPMVHFILYGNDPMHNLPGAEILYQHEAQFVTTIDGTIIITLPEPFALMAGQYWLTVQPYMSSQLGQWFWAKQESPTINQEFCWRNPGGGFGVGCLDWTRASQVPWGVLMQDYNLSFGLYGTSCSVAQIVCPPDLMISMEHPPFLLTGAIPDGGIYSGPGVMGNMFYPMMAGPGTHIISYLFTNECGLLQTCSFMIIVTDCPYVYAGPDATIDNGEVFHLTGASATNYSYLHWFTTNGDGYFDDETLLNPTYFPGIYDIQTGQVDLCLVGSPIPPCTQMVDDCMTLTIIPGQQIITGVITDDSGYPINPDSVIMFANPVCYPEDVLTTENGGITLWTDADMNVNYTIVIVNFEHTTATGDKIEIGVRVETSTPGHTQVTVQLPDTTTVVVDIKVTVKRNLKFPSSPCHYEEINVPAGCTATLDYSNVNFCGNTDVQVWNGTSWTDGPHWNYNGTYAPSGQTAQPQRQLAGPGKYRVHNNYYDNGGFDVGVTIGPSKSGTSPDNREVFATLTIGGRDNLNCDFGDIVANNYTFNYQQGAEYINFPRILGSGGVQQLSIAFESYDNVYWQQMELMLSILPASASTTLFLEIPDATVPLTNVDIQPGDTVCYLYPGGLSPGYHTMTMYLGTKNPVIALNLNALNFASLIPLLAHDFGDAPAPYPTLLVSGGAWHINDGVTFLGNQIDVENDGIPHPSAIGDDLNNLPDEDGVVFPKPFTVGGISQVKVFASVNGYLNAWLDMNKNNSWADAGDQIFTNQPLSPGLNLLNVTIPATAKVGNTFARFRFNTTGGLTFTGTASNGEVEDYMVPILPQNWGFAITSSTHLIAVPVNLNLTGLTLTPDDVLGVFYSDPVSGNKCGGATVWDGLNNQLVIAYGDDPLTPGKDGFNSGENMIWKVFLTATNTSSRIQAQYDPALPNADGKYYDNGLSALSGLSSITQNLQLPANWSGISTYVVPFDPDVVNMFNPIINELIIIQNGSEVYWPAQGVNTIGNWNVYKGYVTKLTTDVNLAVTGTEVDPKTITLNVGWNLVPVFKQVLTSSFLGGLPGFIIAKGIGTAEVYWPALGINTMPYLKTGKAYWVKTSQAGSLSYPDSKDEIIYQKSAALDLTTPWNDLSISPNTHLVNISQTCVNMLETGDYIGAFTETGLCAGAFKVNNDAGNVPLILLGDDPTTSETDGFPENSTMSFRYWRKATGETFDLKVTFDPAFDHSGMFATNALSSITDMTIVETSIHNLSQAGLRIYPNPAPGTFFIAGYGSHIKTTIYTTFGEEIYYGELTLPAKVDLSTQPKGIYVIRIEVDSNVFFEKLILK